LRRDVSSENEQQFVVFMMRQVQESYNDCMAGRTHAIH